MSLIKFKYIVEPQIAGGCAIMREEILPPDNPAPPQKTIIGRFFGDGTSSDAKARVEQEAQAAADGLNRMIGENAESEVQNATS